jgi:hypothetical protein
MKVSRVFVCLGLLAVTASPRPVEASTQSYHLSGVVTRVVGSNASGLAALGVKNGAAVSIDWTVELTTPVHFSNPPTHTVGYLATTPSNGITSFTIAIGGWTATGADPTAQNTVPVNQIVIIDGPPSDPADSMDLSRSAVDTNDLVAGSDPNGSEILLRLFAFNGGGSTSTILGDQTPSAYLDSVGNVVSHSGNEIDFAIPGPDLTVQCRASQLASAGTLCQSTLKCLATHAKAPNKDPLDAKLDACLKTARDKFVAAFDKAAANAAQQGVSCGTSEDGATFSADFDTAEAAVIDVVDAIEPQDPKVISSLYLGGSAMCSAAAKAEAKNITKPSSATLDRLRATARAKLTAAANKAIALAEKKGIVFDPAPDVAAFVDSIDQLVDELVAEVHGP